MGLLEKIFGPKTPTIKPNGFFKLIDGYAPVFHTFGGSIYESELVRTAIDAKARHISKLQVTIQGTARPELQTRLKQAPNTWQTWSQFLARTATVLEMRNNAFIVPVLDKYGDTKGIYTLCPDGWELLDVGGVPWIRFSFSGGDKKAIELDRVGILTKFQYKSDLFGESNSALRETMSLIKIQRQGIEESAKNSASYRIMAQVGNFAMASDLKKEAERFNETNFQNGGGGMLLLPNTYTNIQQLNQQSYAVDANQLKLIQSNISNYFGVNEDVIQNKATGDAWSAFYEGAIEPIAVQLSEVLTMMLFTERERSFGNRIFFTANRLQYMTNKDKLDFVVNLVDRGLCSINEGREVFNLPPVEGGDVRTIRGEYKNTGEIEDAQEDGESQEESNAD